MVTNYEIVGHFNIKKQIIVYLVEWLQCRLYTTNGILGILNKGEINFF